MQDSFSHNKQKKLYFEVIIGYTFNILGGKEMKITGLITEYNPFHNGHKYHIEEAKRLTGADYIVVVMSGDFVQRGAPACMDKYLRTQMALCCGADIVLELPVLFATASAEYFALGAIKMLDSLGFVDSVCFGSELGELAPLDRITEILLNEPANYKNTLAYHLQYGDTYPVARRKALLRELPNNDEALYEEILASPNNILGMEYIKALKLLHSSMKPYTIKRKIANYHDQNLNSEISSATSIRNELSKNNLLSLKDTVPKPVFKILEENYQKLFPIETDDFSSELYHKLLYTTSDLLMNYLDMNEDLCLRICKYINQYQTISQFSQLLKSKNYTMTRINRSLCHVLLQLMQNDLHPAIWHKNEERYLLDNRILPQYIRILGLRKEASFLLKKKNLKNTLPLVTKVADARNILSPEAFNMFTMDLKASSLYQRKIYEKYSTVIAGEYKQGVIIME